MAQEEVTAARDHRRFTDTPGAPVSAVGSGCRVEGSLDGEGRLEVHGEIHGDLRIAGLVWLHPGGRITGNVDARDAVVEGEMRGDLTLSGKVEIRASGRLEGDVRAAVVAAAEGSRLQGRVRMTSGGEERVLRFTERRQ